jgi:hypothetical protein
MVIQVVSVKSSNISRSRRDVIVCRDSTKVYEQTAPDLTLMTQLQKGLGFVSSSVFLPPQPVSHFQAKKILENEENSLISFVCINNLIKLSVCVRFVSLLALRL